MGIFDTKIYEIGDYALIIYNGEHKEELILHYAYECVSCDIKKASYRMSCPGIKPNVGVCEACVEKYDLDSDDLDKRKNGLAMMRMKDILL